MSEDNKDSGDSLSVPPQSEEARKQVLANSSAGGASAVGQARAHLLGEEQERLDNLESRGSTQPIAGGDEIKADYPPHEGAKPIGAQAQPAAFTTNGSLPVNMVASPSGLVPAAAVTGDPEHAAQLVRDANEARDDHILRSGAKKLSRNQIEGMSALELRAVAHQRGYDIGEYAGSRTTRRRFIEAQGKDELTPSVEGETAGTVNGGEPSTGQPAELDR